MLPLAPKPAAPKGAVNPSRLADPGSPVGSGLSSPPPMGAELDQRSLGPPRLDLAGLAQEARRFPIELQGLGPGRWPYFVHFHKAGGTTLCHQASCKRAS